MAPRRQRQNQEDCFEFEASLIYIVSSEPVRTIERSYLKTNKKIIKQNVKEFMG